MAVGSKILTDYAQEIVELLQETVVVVEKKESVGQTTMKDVHLARAEMASAEDASYNFV